MKCVLCNEKIVADEHGWDGGCNEEPVAKGQCCQRCDNTIVLHARLAERGYRLEVD